MAEPALHALVLDLRAAGPGSLTPFPGHQAQALFLQLVQAADPDLAAALHADGQATRHYTVAPLRLPRVRGGRRPFVAGEQLQLRVALLQPGLFGTVVQALLQLGVAADLRLGQMAFALHEVRGTAQSDPWAGFGDWATLAQEARPSPHISLEFATPTAISQSMETGPDGKSRPRNQLLPLPAAIFGSLARRWNDRAPTPLDLDAVRAAAETALVADYTLRTATVEMATSTIKGFYGTVRYECRGDAEARRLLSLLADAAFFLGVGVKTARGMGLCRRVERHAG